MRMYGFHNFLPCKPGTDLGLHRKVDGMHDAIAQMTPETVTKRFFKLGCVVDREKKSDK